MNVILCGMPRCGKSTIGQLVAERLERTFVDTDRLIESYYHSATNVLLPCCDIYYREGERAFRYLEKQAIVFLHSCNSCVIAVGGGALQDPDNVKTLKSFGKLVYLQTDTGTLLERMLSDRIPAFLDQRDPVASLHKLNEERKGIFESAADAIIATLNMSAAEVADKISKEY